MPGAGPGSLGHHHAAAPHQGTQGSPQGQGQSFEPGTTVPPGAVDSGLRTSWDQTTANPGDPSGAPSERMKEKQQQQQQQ